MSSLGTLGPRPRFLLLFFPLPLPLVAAAFGAAVLVGGADSSNLRLFPPAFGAAGLTGAFAASGSRWKLTVGLDKTVGKSFSNSNSPAGDLFSEVTCSAMSKKAARSARRIWIRDVW